MFFKKPPLLATLQELHKEKYAKLLKSDLEKIESDLLLAAEKGYSSVSYRLSELRALYEHIEKWCKKNGLNCKLEISSYLPVVYIHFKVR